MDYVLVANENQTHHAKDYRLGIPPRDSRAPGLLQMHSGASKQKIESDFRRIRVRTFSFSMIANFLGQLATSSLHHRIRLRILHKYSWSDFL